LAPLKLRDRDTIVTREGLIFRVFGYTHPKDAYICDIEYAPAAIFKSQNPKAFRSDGHSVFYKFYEDEGWRFIRSNFPQYIILHGTLGREVIGVKRSEIAQVRRPHETLTRLTAMKPEDQLVSATQKVLKLVTRQSGLSAEYFGVFGSMLHGFHHSLFSDIDLVIYGSKQVAKLCETLKELYVADSPFRNEFETDQSIKGKHWEFLNLSPQEYVLHQRRKLIYALFKDERSSRIIKTEFEPVKGWIEISNEYSSKTRILQCGWVKMSAWITEDRDAPFIPSVYSIEPLKVLEGPREALEAERIVSYIEEFRMQVRRDETVYVEGNLENVTNPRRGFYQIALTYCPRYYEQVLKVAT
jgi:predicted nucleotidyltransferase